jgi:hypothetical protein
MHGTRPWRLTYYGSITSGHPAPSEPRMLEGLDMLVFVHSVRSSGISQADLWIRGPYNGAGLNPVDPDGSVLVDVHSLHERRYGTAEYIRRKGDAACK